MCDAKATPIRAHVAPGLIFNTTANHTWPRCYDLGRRRRRSKFGKFLRSDKKSRRAKPGTRFLSPWELLCRMCRAETSQTRRWNVCKMDPPRFKALAKNPSRHYATSSLYVLFRPSRRSHEAFRRRRKLVGRQPCRRRLMQPLGISAPRLPKRRAARVFSREPAGARLEPLERRWV